MPKREFTDQVQLIEYLQGYTDYSLDDIAVIADKARVLRLWEDSTVRIEYNGLKFIVTPKSRA